MGKQERILTAWLVFSAAASIIVSIIFEASFPIFTLVWLSVPLIAVLRCKNAGCVGFSRVSFKAFITATLLNLAITLAIIAIFEPWSHTYQALIEIAAENEHPDVTFVFLTRLSRVQAKLFVFVFSSFITLFAEEIFFRGWLFQFLKKRVKPNMAIIIQAGFFIVPNIIAALLMTAMQGVIYTVAYTGIAVGIAGGWSAKRTNTIWPSLVSASIVNLLAVIVLY